MICAVLLPTGTANEINPGLAHFYEHLLLQYCGKRNVICSGFTTEDYVLGYFFHSTIDDVSALMEDFTFSESDFLAEQKVILEEIEQEYLSTSEIFFRELWADTPYQSSPMGTKDAVSSIRLDDLIGFNAQLRQRAKYFFTPAHKVSVINAENHNGAEMFAPVHRHRDRIRTFKVQEKEYRALEITAENDILYLIKEIISIFNPGKSISFFEKKEISSFVVETSCRFPNIKKFKTLFPEASAAIKAQLNEIEKQLDDWALNELESKYYKNKTWHERSNTMLTTPVKEAVNCYDELCGLIGE